MRFKSLGDVRKKYLSIIWIFSQLFHICVRGKYAYGLLIRTCYLLSYLLTRLGTNSTLQILMQLHFRGHGVFLHTHTHIYIWGLARARLYSFTRGEKKLSSVCARCTQIQLQKNERYDRMCTYLCSLTYISQIMSASTVCTYRYVLGLRIYWEKRNRERFPLSRCVVRFLPFCLFPFRCAMKF